MIEVSSGSQWEQKQFPKSPLELRYEHAQKALEILDSIEAEPLKMFAQRMNNWCFKEGRMRIDGVESKFNMDSSWDGFSVPSAEPG